MVFDCSLLVLQSSVEMITSVYTWLADDKGEGEHLLCLGVILWLEIDEAFKSYAFCSPTLAHRSMLSSDYYR